MFNSLIGRSWTIDEAIFEQSPYGAMPTGTPTEGNFMVNLNNLPTYSPANIAPGVVHFTGVVPAQRVNPEMIGYESIGFNPGSIHLYPMNYALGAESDLSNPVVPNAAIGSLIGLVAAMSMRKSLVIGLLLGAAGGAIVGPMIANELAKRFTV